MVSRALGPSIGGHEGIVDFIFVCVLFLFVLALFLPCYCHSCACFFLFLFLFLGAVGVIYFLGIVFLAVLESLGIVEVIVSSVPALQFTGCRQLYGSLLVLTIAVCEEKAKQSKPKQTKAKQSKTKQSKTKQSKADQD